VPWVAFYVGIALVGLAVLAMLTWRLWVQVRFFAREVAAASEKFAAASTDLSQLPPRR